MAELHADELTEGNLRFQANEQAQARPLLSQHWNTGAIDPITSELT